MNTSRVDIPFLTDPAAQALAARMLFICGGGTGGTVTGPVQVTIPD